MLPTFLIIGSAKSGTTALHGYLRRHADIAMSRPKELQFFVAEKNWSEGVAWYEQHFAAAVERETPPLAIGETSPDYARCTVHAGVPERIQSVIPDVLLVYLVRHPLERIRSAYQHAVAHGSEMRPIDEAVRTEPHYVDDSRYAMQLDRYLEVFDRSRLLVIGNRALRDDRRGTLGAVGEFVGVDPDRFGWERVQDAKYSSEGRTAPSGLLAKVRSSRLAPAVRSIVPAGVRQRVWRAGSRSFDPDELRMADETARWVMEQLADDIGRIAADVSEAADWR